MSSSDEAYETFVTSDDDVEGLLAYAIFKRHEIRWLDQHQKDTGKRPTPSESSTFIKAGITSSDQYRTEAADTLIGFAESYLQDERPNIEKRAIAGAVEKATGFWRTVYSSIIGFLAVSALLMVVAFSAQRFGINITEALGL